MNHSAETDGGGFPDVFSKRIGLICVLIFVAGFGLRAALWFHSGARILFNHVEVVQTAMCFARNGFLGNPFILPTGPTAHVTPTFPFLIGLMYKIAPDLRTGETLKNVLTIAIASLQFALLPLLARAARLGIRAGLIAGVIGALMPVLYLDCSGDYEAPLVGLTLILCVLATFRLASPSRAPWNAFSIGIAWGLTALVSAQLLLCGVVYMLAREIFVRDRLRHRIVRIGIFAAGVLAAVLPWGIRNYVELGAPVISRDNAGLELYVSNNDIAAPTLDQNLKNRIFVTLHPHGSVPEAKLVQRLGEIRYNELKRGEAMQWIESHRWRFLLLAFERERAFWFSPGGSLVQRVYWMGIFVLGLAGLIVAGPYRRAKLLIFVVMLSVYSLPHLLIEASARYRYPLNPILLLFTGFFFVWFIERAVAPYLNRSLRRHIAPSPLA
jgi:hypothetical protein